MDAAIRRKICNQYRNRLVEIRTVHGVYRGKIVKVDRHRVYLKQLSPKPASQASISFFPIILPLVLFDLLVIVLLETKPPFHPFYF